MTPGRHDPLASSSRSMRLLALAALAAGAAYLTWRALFTLAGAPLILGIGLLSAEVLGLMRLAQLTHDGWWTPSDPPPTLESADVAVVIVVTDQGDADVERTLVACERLAVARGMTVVSRGARPDLTELCTDFGADHVVSPRGAALGLFLDGASRSDASRLLWLDAGAVPLPGLVEVAGRRMADPDVALVQVAQDLMNRDSMAHLRAGRSDEALGARVIGPGRGARGAAPWWGSGSLVRRSALDLLDDADADESGALPRASARLDAAGLAARFEPSALVRSSAPDSLGDYLDRRRRRGVDRLGVLRGPAGLVGRSGLPLRVRARHAAHLIPALAPIQYLLLLAVLVATLVTGRLPLQATATALAATWLPVAILGSLARRSLARGTVVRGDWTRQVWRTLGADVAALRGAVTGRGRRRRVTESASGIAALGQMRVLAGAVVVLDVALLARAATLFTSDLLPPFDAYGPLVVAVALVTLVPMVDVLQLITHRRQRRRQYRLPVDLVARVNGQPVRTVDMTTVGMGVLSDTPVPVGSIVDLEFELPELDRSSRPLRLRAAVTSIADDSSSSATRLGMEFVDVEDTTRRHITRYCMITDHLVAGEADERHQSDPVLVNAPPPEHSRRGLALLTVAAALSGAVMLLIGPAANGASAAADVPVSVCLQTSSGGPISGAAVTYSAGTWTALGPTGPDGCVAGTVPGGPIRVRVTDQNLTAEQSQNTTTDPVFTFTTAPVTVRFQTSTGTPVARVPVSYAGSRWASFGTTAADGTATRELLASSRLRVRVTDQNLTAEQSQNTTTDPVFTFTTAPVTVRFQTSTGTPVAGVPVSYAGSRWASFGTTAADGTATRELLASSRLRVRVTDQNLTAEQSQNTTTDPVFTFTTAPVTVRFQTSTGTPVAGVPVSYAGSRWASFGTTAADGTATRELLASSRLRVRVTDQNLTAEQSQNTTTDPVFTFTTAPVTVRFQTSTGTPVAGVPVSYAGSRWASFGTTAADGTATRELLASSRLRVRVTDQNLTAEQSQNTTTDPVFTFTTGRLIQGDGDTVTLFNAGGWRPFTSGIELLPGSLRLRLDTGAEITVVVIAGETIVVPSGTVVTTTTTTTTTVPPTTTTTTTLPPTTTTTTPTTTLPPTTTTTTVPPTTTTTTTTTTVPPTTTTTTTLPPAITAPPVSEPDETGDQLADLSIDKTLDGSLRSGLVATYVITVTNLGPSPTNGTIIITDDLPSGLEYASSTAPAGTTCIASTSAVTCKTAASIPVDGTVTVTIEVRVVAGSGTRLLNVATVESDDGVNGTSAPGDQVRAAGARTSASVSATVESTGSLPFTGSSWVRLLSAVALVLLATGAGLLAARHRLRRST